MITDEQFNFNDEMFKLKAKRLITASAAVLYNYYAILYYTYGKIEWYYISTKALVSYTNIKRSTIFNCNKQLIKYGLIEKDKRGYIKLKYYWENVK